MEIKSVPTFTVTIYLAGDVNVIKQRCREYCYSVGLCVTVTPTVFIYTGGEECGVAVGLVNYPRFPTTEDVLIRTASVLAEELMRAACQHSALVVSGRETVWLNARDDCPVAK